MREEFEGMIVYIVDDDDVDRTIIARACDELGIECKQYASPLSLLEDLDARSRGCVVTDLRMPEMSGLALHRKIQIRGLGIATIIVTGVKTSTMAERQRLGSGLFGYCSKDDTSILKDLIVEALQVAGRPLRKSRLCY